MRLPFHRGSARASRPSRTNPAARSTASAPAVAASLFQCTAMVGHTGSSCSFASVFHAARRWRITRFARYGPFSSLSFSWRSRTSVREIDASGRSIHLLEILVHLRIDDLASTSLRGRRAASSRGAGRAHRVASDPRAASARGALGSTPRAMSRERPSSPRTLASWAVQGIPSSVAGRRRRLSCGAAHRSRGPSR